MSALRVVHAERSAGLRLRRRIALRLATVLDPRVEKTARGIVAAIRRGGDAALLEAARTHDGFDAAATMADLRLAPLPGDDGWRNVAPAVQDALELAIGNVAQFHRAQLGAAGEGFVVESAGVTLAEVVQPLARVGLYVPGGRASYPSTALMTVVPAQVAGVVGDRGRHAGPDLPRAAGTALYAGATRSRRDLGRRRGPRRRGAGLRNRVVAQSRRHRGSGQRLGDRGQAGGRRRRRDRRPDGPLRGRHRRRRGCRSGVDRRRSPGAGRARSAGRGAAGDDLAPPGEARRGFGRPPAAGARDGGDGARLAARLRWSARGRRPRSRAGARRGDRAGAPAARRGGGRGGRGTLRERRGGLRRRAHPRGLRRLCRGSRVTSCRPAARRASPPASRSRTSAVGPTGSRSTTRPPPRASRRPPWPSPKPRGCRRMRPRPPPGEVGHESFRAHRGAGAARLHARSLALPLQARPERGAVGAAAAHQGGGRAPAGRSRMGALSGLSRRSPARAAGLRPRLDARGGAGRQRLERAARRDDGRGRRSRAGDSRSRAGLRALPGLRARSRERATGRSGRAPTSRCRPTSSSARSTAIRAGRSSSPRPTTRPERRSRRRRSRAGRRSSRTPTRRCCSTTPTASSAASTTGRSSPGIRTW